MRYWMIVFLFVCMAGVSYAQDVLDRIAAIVDDNIILQSDIDQYAVNYAIQSGIDLRNDPQKLEELRAQTLDRLIIQKVLLVKAKLDSVTVEDRRVDTVLDEQITSMTQQLGSEQKLEEYFGAPIRKIKRNFRKEIQEKLLVEALQTKRFANVPITRKEVETFYATMKDSLPQMTESVNLSHLLVSAKAGAEARTAALGKIKEAQKRVQDGEDFAEVAKAYSEDPGSATRGGDLGMTQRGDLVPPFEEAAYKLEPGQISDIVDTQFGFHLIQLMERRGEKIHTRHILVKVPITKNDERNTVVFLDSLRTSILAGEISFEDAAKRYNEDETTKDKGGNLGWFEVSQLQVKEFREVAEKLKPGEISEPIKTQFGYHLVKLNERREARELSIDKDWEQISQWAQNHKRQQEMQDWIESLKKEVYIKINL